MRGKRLNTMDIGIIRIDITASCRSRVLRSRSARPESSCWFSWASTLRLFCASMAWVITSSPTRLISWSTFSTDTRRVEESRPWAAARASGLAAGLGAAATGAGAATSTGAGALAWTAGASDGAPGASSKKP